MGTINIQIPKSDVSLEELANIVAMLAKELAYVLDGNLDLSNLRANSVTADRIKAGTITADRMKVTQLSAISADLGTIVAGIIYGAYIATANGTYPRIEFNSVGNLLTAFLDAANNLSIMPNLGGVPALRFTNASNIVGHLSAGASVSLTGSGIDVDVQSTTNVNIGANSRVNISAPLGIVINGLNSLVGTKIYYVSDTVGGVVNRKLTFKDGLLVSET